MHSYFNGYREGVLFLFYNPEAEKVLLEIRNPQEYSDIFFTNGSVEEKDKLGTLNTDYKLNALLREISEEFAGQVTVDVANCTTLSTFFVDGIKIIFYIYLIKRWSGTFPTYTIEEGERFSDLIWLSLEDAKQTISYESGKEIIDLLQSHLKTTII